MPALQFSQTGYSALIKRAGGDGVLTLTVGQRGDLSVPQLKDLLAGSADIVRRRLFEVAKPDKKAAINQAMVEIIGAPKQSEIQRDFAPAQRAILALHHAGELNEAALLNFAKAHKYEECVAALSALSAARIATIDRVVYGRPPRSDPDPGTRDRPRMGERARADPAAARPGTRAFGHRHRGSAAEFRAAGGLDRAAGAEFLADAASRRNSRGSVMRGLDPRIHLHKSSFERSDLPWPFPRRGGV